MESPTETQVSFRSGDNTLYGVHHAPGSSKQKTGIVFLHGWSGCRLGPHRMFVNLARALSEDGYPCLRFDFAGRGESQGAQADASIQTMIDDTTRAVAFLREHTDVERIVCLGICSGAKVAMGAAAMHSGIDGLILLSHELMGDLRKDSGVGQRKSASTFRTYLSKLTRRETWKKILTGRVNTRMVKKAMFEHEAPDAAELVVETDWLTRLASFSGPLLFVYGSNDPSTVPAMDRYQPYCSTHGLQGTFHVVPDANHSFYSIAWEREVVKLTRNWMENPHETTC